MDPRFNVYVTFVADDDADGEDTRALPADGARIADHGSRRSPLRKKALKNGDRLPIKGMRQKARRATK